MPVKWSGWCVALCGWVLCAQLPHRAQAQGWFGSSAQNATFTEYDGEQVVARVRAAKVFPDHEKWGFFRVGLLPLAVAQEVRVQVQSANCLTNAFADLNSLKLSARNCRRLEFRDFQLFRLGETAPRLCAASARINPAGNLDLFNVRVVRGNAASAVLAKATLTLSGPQAGALRWRDGENAAELFVLKPPENPQP